LAREEAEHGDALAALDYLTLAVRNYHDSGNPTQMHTTLGGLAVILDRLGRHEPAATIAGFARSPFTAAIPELEAAIIHLRDVLGNETYDSLAARARQ
jgi:hypothetical protein